MKKILFLLVLLLPGFLFSQVVIDMGASARGSDVVILTDTTSANSAYGKLYYYSGNYYAGNSNGYYDLLPNPSTASLADGNVITWDAATKSWVPASQGSSSHLQADWISNYTSGKDTIGFKAAPKFHPMGNDILYDRTQSQYTRYTGTELSVMDNDVIDCFWLKTNNVVNNQYVAGYLSYDEILFYGADYPANDGKILRLLDDGSSVNNQYWTPSHNFRDGRSHFIVIIVRQLKYFYFFIDGKFDYYAAKTNDLTMSSESFFDVSGTLNSWYLDGSIDEYRRFLQGKEGIYASGTGGTDLELRVGDATGDVIYSEVYPNSPTNPGGMIPLMYKNPSADLSDIGFGSLKDADRTELVSNNDFESGFTSGLADNWYKLEQTAGNTYSDETSDVHAGSHAQKIVAVNTGWQGINKTITTIPGDYYEFSAWMKSSETNVDLQVSGDTNFYSGSDTRTFTVTADTWTKVSNVWKSSITSSNIRIWYTANLAGDYLIIDDASIKRVGEVCHYKMNESGTPSTLVDETSNSLDLTTSGSPVMEANDYETLDLKRASVDTVFADTLNARAGDFTDVYFGERSSVPGVGTDKPMIYASSGELYAHDASGNNRIISPHFGKDWVFNSWNSNTGVRTFVNMVKFIRAFEAMTGKKFIYEDTVAVQMPAKVAADTLYRMVYDSLTQKNTKIMIVRAKRGFYKRNGKFYKIEKSRISEPPAQYKKDNLIGLEIVK